MNRPLLIFWLSLAFSLPLSARQSFPKPVVSEGQVGLDYVIADDYRLREDIGVFGFFNELRYNSSTIRLWLEHAEGVKLEPETTFELENGLRPATHHLRLVGTPAEVAKVEAWMKRRFGADKWHLLYEPKTQLIHTRKDHRKYGICGWHYWRVELDPTTAEPQLRRRARTTVHWGDAYYPYYPQYLFEHGLWDPRTMSGAYWSYEGPAWLAIAGAIFVVVGPIVFVYVLRKPLWRAFTFWQRRTSTTTDT